MSFFPLFVLVLADRADSDWFQYDFVQLFFLLCSQAQALIARLQINQVAFVPCRYRELTIQTAISKDLTCENKSFEMHRQLSK
jgi:hypothetical protein